MTVTGGGMSSSNSCSKPQYLKMSSYLETRSLPRQFVKMGSYWAPIQLDWCPRKNLDARTHTYTHNAMRR